MALTTNHSSDLNPIEHVQAILDHKMKNNIKKRFAFYFQCCRLIIYNTREDSKYDTFGVWKIVHFLICCLYKGTFKNKGFIFAISVFGAKELLKEFSFYNKLKWLMVALETVNRKIDH